MARHARAGRLVAALGAAAIVALTLYPQPGAALAAASTPLYCLVCGDHGGADAIRNVLLFMPFGLGIRLATGSMRRAVGLAAAISLSVELLQLTVVAGRDASLSDLLTNTTGGGVGSLIASRLGLLARPSPRAGWTLLLTGSGLVLTLLGLSAWIQTPTGGAHALSSTWAIGASPGEFQGRVIAVTAGGVPMPATGVPPNGAALRSSLRQGRISLHVQVVTGPPSGGRWRWIYVIGEPTRPTLFLSQQGRSAVFGVPARSQALRLHPPTVVLRRAFPADSGVMLTLRAGEWDRTLWLASEHPGAARVTKLALSPSHGWTLIAPTLLGYRHAVRLTTALLLGAATLLLGYWGAATGAGLGAATTLGAAVLTGLGAVPAVAGFQPVHWSEWVAAGTGAAAGWALHRVATYLQARCGSPSASVSSSS